MLGLYSRAPNLGNSNLKDLLCRSDEHAVGRPCHCWGAAEAMGKKAMAWAFEGKVDCCCHQNCNLLRPLIKMSFLLVPYGYIIIKIKKEFLRR